MTHTVTFVSAYIRIYQDDYDQNKTFEKRLSMFQKMVEQGIPICLFTSHEYEYLFQEMARTHTNLRVLGILEIDNLWFTQNAQANDFVLPERRSDIKDTYEYMLLMHAKIDFMKRAIDTNPFQHDTFAWFDFSLPYLFNDMERSLLILKNHACRQYTSSFLAMPGCWGWEHPFGDEAYLQNQVCWRFCGSFFLGDKTSVLEFYQASVNHFTEFLAAMKYHMVWEVNYWAYLEANGYIHPLWYSADHNDSIIQLPYIVYTKTLIEDAHKLITYPYPNIEAPDQDVFFPSSAAYIYDRQRQKHILNTRYVNYYYQNNWDCLFFNDARQIRSLNVCSELNKYFDPIQYDLVAVDETGLQPNPHAFSMGLEDIRLYQANDKLMFIASNVHYIPSQQNRMIIGEYNDEENLCKNMHVVHMQWESPCEKNWCPLPQTLAQGPKMYFIYKWSPYTVGYVDPEQDHCCFQTCIEQSYQHTLLNRFRGSSSFLDYDANHWIGLVHFSENTVPPLYYHCLVLVQKDTLLPVRFSDPFRFSSQPIEFCTGFTIDPDTSCYMFWISQMDRDPKLFMVKQDKISLHNSCF